LSSRLTFSVVSDATILLRDIAGDAAQHAANRVNPSQDQLSQIDQAADDNTWHDTPDFSRDNLRNQVKGQYNKQKPFSRDDVKNAVGDASQNAHPSGSRDPADAARLAQQDQQHGNDSGVDPRSGIAAGAQNLRDQTLQNVPQETQDRARNATNRSTDYLKNKLPQERRDQTIYRLKKMIVEIQGHRDCMYLGVHTIPVIDIYIDQQAIETLLGIAEQYAGHGKSLTQQGAGTVKGAHEDSALTAAETDLKVCSGLCDGEEPYADRNEDTVGTVREFNFVR
jgi:hypothetical protein